MRGEIKMPVRGNSAAKNNISIERATFAGEELLKWLKKSPGEADSFIRIALDELQSINAETEIDSSDLIKRLAERMYSPQSKPAQPISRFWVGNTPVCTPGNLTTISAQAKAGKSAAISAMIASTFAGSGADCLGFVSENPDGFAVVHIDTEQCRFDHWEGIQRAIRRAKVAAAPLWLRSCCLTGFSAADVRAAIPMLIKQAAKQFGGIHSVIIDGIADSVLDVNDAKETSSLITDLHKWAIEFDCPILNIIHVNPSSESKTRGHLGSQLERKSETNLRLEKDKDGTSLIWADKNRRAPIPKESAPCFSWNNGAGMHVSVQNPTEAKAEAKADSKLTAMRQGAKTVFARGGKPELAHKKLVELVAVEFELENSGARRRVENWFDSQIVSKNEGGFYTLAP